MPPESHKQDERLDNTRRWQLLKWLQKPTPRPYKVHTPQPNPTHHSRVVAKRTWFVSCSQVKHAVHSPQMGRTPGSCREAKQRTQFVSCKQFALRSKPSHVLCATQPSVTCSLSPSSASCMQVTPRSCVSHVARRRFTPRSRVTYTFCALQPASRTQLAPRSTHPARGSHLVAASRT